MGYLLRKGRLVTLRGERNGNFSSATRSQDEAEVAIGPPKRDLPHSAQTDWPGEARGGEEEGAPTRPSAKRGPVAEPLTPSLHMDMRIHQDQPVEKSKGYLFSLL